MANPEEMREYLAEWPCEERQVPELARDFPDCACEGANSPDGSHGPVQDDETLRYFVNSRSDVDLKRKKPFGPAKLGRMFDKGLSLCRVDMAAVGEVRRTAEMLFSIMRDRDPVYGGIVGVLDFRCLSVRTLRYEDGGRMVCVLETPLDPSEDGGFDRPSHADLVHSRQHCIDPQAIRLVVFNAMREDASTTYTPLEAVDGGSLVEFLPASLQSAIG